MRIFTLSLLLVSAALNCTMSSVGEARELPEPEITDELPVLEAIFMRRSLRDYSDESVTLEELGILLYSAQGITSDRGFRAAPSAGATYPAVIMVLVADVDGLQQGLYIYRPYNSTITMVRQGDLRQELASAALDQPCLTDAPMVLIIAADYENTTSVYGDRGITYVHMEAGHISQNIYLQCTELGLGTVAVGAFHDQEISQVLQLDEGIVPLYLMPVGRPVIDG